MVTCARCGQANPEGFRFCGACGAPLAQAPAAREERKVVSVLFADLVGFTSRSERLDPEDVRAMLSPYFARVREEIERMDAERQNLEQRVAYATITLQVNQERQASLDMGPLPMSAKFRNAIVDGLRTAVESLLGLTLWLLRVGPSVLLWTIVLWWPVRFAIRRGRTAGAA